MNFLNRMTSLLCQFINFFKGGRVPLNDETIRSHRLRRSHGHPPRFTESMRQGCVLSGSCNIEKAIHPSYSHNSFLVSHHMTKSCDAVIQPVNNDRTFPVECKDKCDFLSAVFYVHVIQRIMTLQIRQKLSACTFLLPSCTVKGDSLNDIHFMPRNNKFPVWSITKMTY